MTSNEDWRTELDSDGFPIANEDRKDGRFLALDDVAAELATSRAQVYALVRRNELPAIKIGGRGQWRVERSRLEEFIARAYDETATWIRDHPHDPDADDS